MLGFLQKYRRVFVVVVAAGLAIGVGQAARANLASDCCSPGAACCHPGAACCTKGHAKSATAQPPSVRPEG
jgi:hypothetical protein